MTWDTNKITVEKPKTIAVVEDPSKPMVIGLSGKAGAGKNMVGMYLAMLADLKVISCRQVGFADALKSKAQAMGWNGLKDAPGRHFLQAMGTKYRGMNVNHWLEPIASLLSQSRGLVVITDVRFPNEAKMIKNWGGEVWRVHKTVPQNASARSVVMGLSGKAAEHTSETALDGWEFDANLYAPASNLDTLVEVTECEFGDFLGRHKWTGD